MNDNDRIDKNMNKALHDVDVISGIGLLNNHTHPKITNQVR